MPWQYLLIALAVLVAAFLALVATRPADFRIVRTTRMAAPPASVFDQVNDLRRRETWSPWAKLDPAMQQTYEGAPSGVGAITSWNGNKKVGAGRMTILDSRPFDLIRIKLEFYRPFKATNTTEFAFRPDGQGTHVEWSMTGRHGFVSKAFCLFFNMDKLVGADFDKGLAQLKASTELAPVT